MSRQQKQAFKKWYEAANNEEQCDDREIASLLKLDSNSDASDKSKTSKKRKKSMKSRALKVCRVEAPSTSSTNMKEVQILMKSDDENSSDDDDEMKTKSIHRGSC